MSYNQKLYALINAKALCECVIPVFICDSELHACLVSQGARKSFKSITVGKDLSGYFSKEAIEEIKALNGDMKLVKFSRRNKYASAIVMDGVLDGERFVAIIIEPQFMFCQEPAPWYINETFEAIRTSVNELLLLPKASAKHLEWYCATLARLCSFTEDFAEERPYSATHSSDIYAELDIVMNESAKVLEGIGGAPEYNKCVKKPFVTNIEPKHLYLITTTLLTALILVSADGGMKVDCRTTEEADAFMEIALTVHHSLPLGVPIENMDALLGYLPYLRLELAAAIDMAEHLKLTLECRSDGDMLTVSVRIPADTTGTVRFRSTELVDSKMVREYLLALCEQILS